MKEVEAKALCGCCLVESSQKVKVIQYLQNQETAVVLLEIWDHEPDTVPILIHVKMSLSATNAENDSQGTK